MMLKRFACFLALLSGLGLAPAQVAIPPTTISPTNVNTSDLGFLVRTVGIDWPNAGGSAWMNSVANMELALGPVTTNTGPGRLPSAGAAIDPTTGRFATNCANFLGGNNPNITAMLAEQGVGSTGSAVPSDTNGFWVLDAANFVHPYINCDANGPPSVANGVFNSPQYPHNYFPGVPTCANPSKGNNWESIACSFMGYLNLPAGSTTLNVNSDDGFLLMLSPLPNPYDARGLVSVGEFDGGRGSATTTMTVNIAQAGWYTARLDFEQGQGGILCEFYSTDSSGNNWLVDDTTSTKALRAYPTPETFPDAYPISLSPANGTQFAPDAPPQTVTVAVQDGTQDQITNIIAVKINGSPLTNLSVSVTPSFTPNGRPLGNITSVSASSPSLATLPIGQTAPIEIDYENSQGISTNLVWNIVTAGTNGVYRELWTNLSQTLGDTLLALTNTLYNPAWPNSPAPAYTTVLNSFQTPANTGMNYYGQRLRTYILPPTTGAYTFWIASDDTSSLFLSSDQNPANEQLIAYVSSATAAGQYTLQPNQQSAPVNLVAGRLYYLEAIMQQGSGADNLSVQWRLPNGVTESPIPASRMTVNYAPAILAQPANTTVTEQTTANFVLEVSTFKLPAFQWRENGTNLVAGTNATLTLTNILLAASGSSFDCVVSNFLGSVTSIVATLTVTRDTTPPTLISAYNLGLTNVTIGYSKPVSPATAVNLANYLVNPAVSVTAAAMIDAQTVALQVSPLSMGANYTVTVSGVQDLAASPNTIAPNSQISFVAGLLAPATIGQPSPSGSGTAQPNGLDLTGGGAIGGTADAAQFDYLVQSGNFDVQVRAQSLGLSSPWAKAGLMARVGLDAGSAFAAVFATPSIANCFFDSRPAEGSVDSVSGSFPVNYPDTWLRLKRSGNLFTGYAGFDGTNWVQLGTISLTANPVYLGLVVASQNSGQTTLAQFRDFGNVVGGAIGNFSSPYEPLGPSSRRTQFVFSEIMYTPAARADGLNTEYLELYNSNPWFDDISGYQLAGEIQYTFPSNTIVPGGGFLVVAAAPADMQTAYGITNVLGPYSKSLKKGGEVQLINAAGGIVLDVTYTNTLPWPAGAHGTGHSIVLARPTYGEADPRAWALSDIVGGSPGGPEAYRPSPLRNVVINEFLANPADGQSGYVEFYNHGAAAVDLSGCSLSDGTTNQFVVPTNSVVPAGGFLTIDQAQLGFGLSPAGGLLLFWNPAGSRVLDAVTYEPQGRGISSGRWPDGGDDFYPLAQTTPGASNGRILIGDIVINEIMYKPISGNDADQYVELYNQGTNSVDLTGWQFVAGINFALPSGTVIAPGGYLVVTSDQTNLFAKYPNLSATNAVGNYAGKLPHKGGRLALARPDFYLTTNNGSLTTNAILTVEDEVTYQTGGQWGQWSHGGGSSLELINPQTNHRLAYNWADSDETGKSSWTNMTFTGLLDNGANYGSSIQIVQLGLMDVGEALVDNLIFQSGTTGPNLIQNPGFESGLQGWETEGDHVTSGLETAAGLGGYQSPNSLHLRATDGVWTGLNSVEGGLTANTLGSGATATLGLTGRWLHGAPYFLLRVGGNWIELTGALPVPANLGTPGLPNSRMATNAPPAIFAVKHSPAIPAANQAVVVTARFHDLNGFQPELLYRVDTQATPTPSYITVLMNDTGTGGDALAGDGIYSATIPGHAAGTVVAFLVQAADSVTGAKSVFPQALNDNSGLPRECVVVFGDQVPAGTFGHWHLWLTQNWINHWINQAGIGNGGSDATLVDGGGRIIYNITGRYAGSPYHQYTGSPVSTVGGMNWSLPDDDVMFGAASLNKQHVPGNGPLDDNTLQREQTSFWMARQLGMHWDYRRYYILYVNGNRHGPLMEDSQTPDGDMVNEYFPNDNNGFLYKNNSWFEFQPKPPLASGLGFDNWSWCTLDKFTTTINGVTGQPKLARYRWNYWVRQYPDSPNNFTNVYALINAANLPTSNPSYYQTMEALVDTEEWMRWSALEHATGDWDSFMTQNEWNMFSYKPLSGKWSLIKWDWNISLGNSGSWGPDGGNLFNVSDSVMSTFQNYPPYRRAMLRAFLDLANGPMNNANSDPIVDAKYAAFAANGLPALYPGNVVDPGTAGLKAWIGTMRSSLLSAISSAGMANVPFAIAGSTNIVTAQNSVTLTGAAPLQVKTITVNGQQFFVTWPSLKNWSVKVSLFGYYNTLIIQGIDSYGNPVAGTSATVSVTDTSAPQDYSYIPYAQPDLVYSQNFDSLPNPGAVTVNTANPVTINGLTYSLGDPFEFGAPVLTTGPGGLGLPFTLTGWYGWAETDAKLGASAGDQTTGGIISFGPTNAANGNRALGLLATSTTGSTAFGAKFVNQSGVPLNLMSLQYTGELWRQRTLAKTISFGYYLDPSATNGFPTNVTAWLTNMDINFPPGSSAVEDGTAPANQESLAGANQPISEWMPGAALWLVWQMTDPTGKGQGLAIDNFTFSASALPVLAAQPTAGGLELTWPTAFDDYTVQQSFDLSLPGGWTDLGLPSTTNGGWNSVTVPLTNAVQFFRLSR